MAKQQTAVVDTAAERLATARAGLDRLRQERATAGEQKRAAQQQFEGLDAKLFALHRQADVEGADVALAVASVTEQRAGAARQVSAASLAADDLDRRIAAVRAELPGLEADWMQEELAAAVVTGKDTARRYRAAIEALIEAGIELQGDLDRCTRLSDGIFARGREPGAKLAAHLVKPQELDRVYAVAREFEPSTVEAATRNLFERWSI